MMDVTLASGKTLSLNFVHSTPFKWVEDADDELGGHFECNYKDPTKPLSATRARVDGFAQESERRLTFCELVEMGDNGADGYREYNILGEGWAVCHPKDNFAKATGRKIALAGALDAAEFDHDARAEVWAKYLEFLAVPFVRQTAKAA